MYHKRITLEGSELTELLKRKKYLRIISEYLDHNLRSRSYNYKRFLLSTSNSKFKSLFKDIQKIKKKHYRIDTQIENLNKILTTEIDYEDIDCYFQQSLIDLFGKYNFWIG